MAGFDMNGSYEKKGYLYDVFKMFSLMGLEDRTYEYHYHDFCKLLIFLNGDVTYSIEGKNYKLKPYDFVLVDRGAIHKPQVNPKESYDRIVFYISDAFFQEFSESTCNLHYCYERAKKEGVDVLRFPALVNTQIRSILQDMQKNNEEKPYASDVYARVLFTELMILINRGCMDGTGSCDHAVTYNQKMIDLLYYIGEHLTEEMSVDELAGHFFISKYHMMRQFKQETGYTIHQYITEKRVLLANSLMKTGMSATDACFMSGFKDYSTFLRAYKSRMQKSPTEKLKV